MITPRAQGDSPVLLNRLYRRSPAKGASNDTADANATEGPAGFNTRAGFKRRLPASGSSNNGTNGGAAKSNGTPAPKFFKPKPKVQLLPASRAFAQHEPCELIALCSMLLQAGSWELLGR